MGRRLPKHVLTISEAEQVLQQPDIHGPLGLAGSETFRAAPVFSPGTIETRGGAEPFEV